jgi:hypothetical protein
LGRWISGEGRKFANLPEYAQLVSDHERFHQAAAEVIRKADSGQHMEKEVALGAKSDYAVASNAVVTSLMKMRTRVNSAA